MRFTSFLTVSTIGLALVACRSDSNNTVDSNGGGGDGSGSNGGYNKIQDVQNDSMAPGTPVKLHNVVVTAIDAFGSKTGDIWVEEPEGGPWSGVHVYKADVTAVATLAVGDTVDISNAIKDEFALTGSANADPTGRTETELEPTGSGQSITVVKTGTGTVPAPANVDALMIGQLADADMQGSAFSAAWEQWEGVLIKTSNVTAASQAKAFGSTMPTPADNYSFGITGVAKVEGSLADITMSGIARGSCLASVTGVVSYFYDYLLLPTQSSDMVTGGTGCPALETACADSIDNDGNGFADCGDDNCIGTDQTCRATTTVSAIDTAVDANPAMPTLPTGGVEIDGVYVSAIAGTNFWVTSSASAAADSGLYVFGGGQALPAGIVKGSKVNLIGRLQAYKAKTTSTEVLTELNLISVTMVNGNGNIQPATTQTSATLTVTATGRPWVGSLVTIGPLNKVATVQTMANHYTGTLTNGATTYEYLGTIIDDSTATVNKCYGAVTGIWTWDGFNNKYALIPTVALPAGANCP